MFLWSKFPHLRRRTAKFTASSCYFASKLPVQICGQFLQHEFTPRGKVWPLGYISPRGELWPIGRMFTPSLTPRCECFLLLSTMEGQRDGLYPWGSTFPLGAMFTPGAKFRVRLKIGLWMLSQLNFYVIAKSEYIRTSLGAQNFLHRVVVFTYVYAYATVCEREMEMCTYSHSVSRGPVFRLCHKIHLTFRAVKFEPSLQLFQVCLRLEKRLEKNWKKWFKKCLKIVWAKEISNKVIMSRAGSVRNNAGSGRAWALHFGLGLLQA
jgi:hypothetical protein